MFNKTGSQSRPRVSKISKHNTYWVGISSPKRETLSSSIPNSEYYLASYPCLPTARRRRPWASSWRTPGRGCPRCRWWTPSRPWRSCRRSRGSSRCASAAPRTRWSASPRCLQIAKGGKREERESRGLVRHAHNDELWFRRGCVHMTSACIYFGILDPLPPRAKCMQPPLPPQIRRHMYAPSVCFTQK